MTNQQIFNRVAKHLLTQNKKSRKGSNCLYRGPGGLKCAVGCLIKDKNYDPKMEGNSITDDEVQVMLEKSGVPTRDSAISLLMDLQDLHDYSTPSRWPGALRRVAKDHELRTTWLP